MKVKISLETGKGLRRVSEKFGRQVMMPSLKEQDGKILTERERILERCAEFYENL